MLRAVHSDIQPHPGDDHIAYTTRIPTIDQLNDMTWDTGGDLPIQFADTNAWCPNHCSWPMMRAHWYYSNLFDTLTPTGSYGRYSDQCWGASLGGRFWLTSDYGDRPIVDLTSVFRPSYDVHWWPQPFPIQFIVDACILFPVMTGGRYSVSIRRLFVPPPIPSGILIQIPTTTIHSIYSAYNVPKYVPTFVLLLIHCWRWWETTDDYSTTDWFVGVGLNSDTLWYDPRFLLQLFFDDRLTGILAILYSCDCYYWRRTLFLLIIIPSFIRNWWEGDDWWFDTKF